MNENIEFVDEVQTGRILHYVVLDSCHAAIATKSDKNGITNLQVFANYHSTPYFMSDVKPSHKEMLTGTWHWPRECNNLA